MALDCPPMSAKGAAVLAALASCTLALVVIFSQVKYYHLHYIILKRHACWLEHRWCDHHSAMRAGSEHISAMIIALIL